MMEAVGKTSVWPLPDGRFRAKVYVKDRFDRLRPIEREGKTAAIAKKRAEAAAAEAVRLLPSAKMSVLAMCEAFVARCEERGRADATVKGYRRYKDDYIGPTIGHIRIAKLTPGHVEEMLSAMSEKDGLNCRAFLRAAINKIARKADPNLPNVASVAEAPEYKPRGAVRLTEANFRLALEAEPDATKRAFFLLLADTGLRPSEARHLTWWEIHRRDDGDWIKLAESKTAKGLDAVPISRLVAPVLQALPKTSEYLFPSNRIKGKPYNETTWRGYWEEAQKRAGVPQTTIYQLRHYFGTVMARTVRDDVLSRLMRHTDVRTSKQYYVHAFDTDLRAAKEQ